MHTCKYNRHIDVENLSVRELNIAGGVIAQIDRGIVVGITDSIYLNTGSSSANLFSYPV